MTNARLAEISLPDFGMSETMPAIPAEIYRDRLERLRACADEHGYDQLIVYADREHSANLAGRLEDSASSSTRATRSTSTSG